MKRSDQTLINKIVLGTVQLGLKYGINNTVGKPDYPSVNSILDIAFNNKISLLDTAEAYGDSQEAIGNYHKHSGNIFNVITKYSPKRDDLPKKLTERICHDLRTLNISTFYCYMFHSFNDFQLYYELFKNEIRELKSSGLIQRFGVSAYTNNEIEALLKHDSIDLIQLPFNLLDNFNQRATVIDKAKQRGIEIHTRSSFLQGLFFKNINDLPGNLMALKPYLSEVNKISKSNGVSLNDLSLNYVTRQKYIDKVLIGVDSADQLSENLISLKNNISLETMQQVDRIKVKETALLNPSNWN